VCNCNRPKPTAPPIPRATRGAVRQPRAVPPPIRVEQHGSQAATKVKAVFCDICGWGIKSVRFFDMITKKAIDKSICTNKSCANHRKGN
jgi:hypothetical protein